MTKPNYTHIHMLFDRSGSMSGRESDVAGWFKGYIDEQKGVPGECTVSAAQFDDISYDETIPPMDIQKCDGKFVLAPRGNTPLLDSVARSINDLGRWLESLPESKRPDRVLVIVQTDGYENASHEYTREKLKELVRQQQERYSWQFMFLGADIDAYGVGGSIGFNKGSTLSYGSSPAAYVHSFITASAGTTRWRTGMTGTVSFTLDEQKEAEATKLK